MALYLRQNFVSAQYLENKLACFHQILCMHSYWQDLAWDCCKSFFAHLYQSYGPWFMPKFSFRSISWEQIDRISPNFMYALIFTRSSLGLLQVIFRTFVLELWLWFTPKFSFSSISWEQIDRISLDFIYAFIFTRSSLGLLHAVFCTFVTELWPLIYAKFCFRSISWEQIGRISPNFIYAFILTRSSLWQSYGPWLMSEFVPAHYL